MSHTNRAASLLSDLSSLPGDRCVFLTTLCRRVRLLFLVAAWCVVILHVNALAQNLQHTKGTPDLALRSDLRVDPSTLAMSLQIPLHVYDGRAGMSQPVTLYYSSKLWRIAYDEYDVNQCGSDFDCIKYTTTRGIYAESSVSGWVSSLNLPNNVPFIEWPDERYNSDGRPCCENNPNLGSFVRRLRVRMPDGSTHELRKSDSIITANGNNPAEPGMYYAVDGSRLKYEVITETQGKLYLPDGTLYNINTRIDRHGNVINTGSGGTDTLGRPVTGPLLDSTEAHDDLTYSAPGVEGTAHNYKFRWLRLAEVLTRDENGNLPPLRYIGDKDKYSHQVYSPSLFISDSDNRVLNDGIFNPVVLHEIVLPTGGSYKFTYNVYGEIDKVIFPTGGYERFAYDFIPALGDLSFPYTQANRGVVGRWVSASGTGNDERAWVYATTGATVTTTAPDMTRTERRLHVGRPASAKLYGFEDVRAGMPYEERVYSAPSAQYPEGRMLRRTLTEWDVSGPTPGGHSSATRDPRVIKQVNILLDTNGSNALWTATVNRYEQPSQPLNVTATTEYGYNGSMAVTTAASAPIGSFDPPDSQALRTTETAYLDDPAYTARGLVSLPTSSTVRSGMPETGAMMARAEMRYDEASYSPLPCGATAGRTDPGTTARGNLTTSRNWLNTTNSYLETHAQYDNCGNLRKSWDAKGGETEIRYDDLFYDETNRNTFAYPTHTLTPVPDTDGSNGSAARLETQTKYDYQTGRVTSTIDANNRVINFSYRDEQNTIDPLDRVRKVTQPDGGWTKYDYGDMAGNLFVRTRTAIDDGRSTDAYQYFDGLGRPLRAFAFDGSAPERAWIASDTEYDTMGRVQRTSNPYFVSTLGGSIDPAQVKWTVNEYDDLGRLKSVTTPDGAQVTTTYSGREVTVTDQAGKTRKSVTDGLGRLEKVSEAPGVADYDFETAYEYDVLGNLKKVIQGKAGQVQQTRTFSYNSLSRLTAATNPESGMISYEYDENGNLKRKVDARQVQTDYDYDALNRVSKRSYSIVEGQPTPPNYTAAPGVDYLYDGTGMPTGTAAPSDAAGRLTAVKSSVSHTLYTQFDESGRVSKHRQVSEPGTTAEQPYEMEYDYNLAGALTWQKYPSGRIVETEYDAAGRIAGVKNGATSNYYAGAAAGTAGIRYAAHGAMEAVKLGNGLWEVMQYNSRLQTERIKLGTTDGGIDRWQLEYGYGTDGQNNGNLRSQTMTVPTIGTTTGFTATQTYTYDALNRIKTATESGDSSWQQKFIYDHFGNRRFDASETTVPQITEQNEHLTNPAISPANNRISSAGYRYDAAGNLECDPGHPCGQITPYPAYYAYDAENRLRTAGSGTTYSYNGDGKRVKKVTGGVTTIFVYNVLGQMVAEYSSAAPAANGTQYLTADHLGTPRVVTLADGAVKSRHDYLPFGEELFANMGGRSTGQRYAEQFGVKDGVRQQFTGQERDDETGLDYMKARYYSSQQGRFTSPDMPFVDQRQTSPQSWNLYAYVRNNPCNNTDPSGRCSAPAGLKAGSVGICIEAFIAAPRIGRGGVGYGDGRTDNGNNPNLTNRIQVQIVLTANKEGVSATYNVRPGISFVSTGSGLKREGTMGEPNSGETETKAGFLGTASAKVSGEYSRPAGSEDFGTTTLNVTGTAQNGVSVLAQGLQALPNPPLAAAGHVIEAVGPPAGTIDFNVNLRVSGSGQVEFTDGTSKGYPTYAGYSYTFGANGQVQTQEIFLRRENQIEDLTRPQTPIPRR